MVMVTAAAFGFLPVPGLPSSSADWTGELDSSLTTLIGSTPVVHGLLSSLSMLQTAAAPASQRVRRRVLLISYDIAGPNLNGGIGTANTAMARLLARQHNVTVLHAGALVLSPGSRLTFPEWQRFFLEQYRVRLLTLPAAPSYQYEGAMYEMQASYELLLWLVRNAHDFDIVHVHEWRGLAYFPLLSVMQGHPALDHLVFVTMCHATTLWTAIGNTRLPSSLSQLEVDWMERQTVRYSQYSRQRLLAYVPVHVRVPVQLPYPTARRRQDDQSQCGVHAQRADARAEGGHDG